MDDNAAAQEKIRKVAGGVEIEVTYADGRTEWVKVRQISPIKEFDRYLAALKDEAVEVELVCNREKGWAETLTPESFDSLAEKSQELNLPLFQKKYRRLRARSEAMSPGLAEKLERDIHERASKAASLSLQGSTSQT